MGMVFCRGCAKEIHDSAATCPHCGATQILVPAKKEPGKLSIWLLIVGYIAPVVIPFLGLLTSLGIAIYAFKNRRIGHGIGLTIFTLIGISQTIAVLDMIRYR